MQARQQEFDMNTKLVESFKKTNERIFEYAM